MASSSLCVVAGMRFHLPWDASLPHRRQAHQPEAEREFLPTNAGEEKVCRFPRCPLRGRPILSGIPWWIAKADPETLRAAVARLSTRVTKLEQENAALEFAAESFGALADRLTRHSAPSARYRHPDSGNNQSVFD